MAQKIPGRVPKQLKLPTVLTVPEVDQLIDAIRKGALKCFFWTVYSLGLRLQEALHLQVADIDAGRMLVHVRRGKGHNLRQIQKYLGHSSLQSTMIYLHLTTVGEEIAVAKLNLLMSASISSSRSRPPR